MAAGKSCPRSGPTLEMYPASPAAMPQEAEWELRIMGFRALRRLPYSHVFRPYTLSSHHPPHGSEIPITTPIRRAINLPRRLPARTTIHKRMASNGPANMQTPLQKQQARVNPVLRRQHQDTIR